MVLDFIRCMDKGIKYISKQGGFLTTKSGEEVNTSTISWATMGYLWGKPVVTIMIRKSRYIYNILEKGESFTISVPTNSELKKALNFFGSKSGRDIDKYKASGVDLKEARAVDIPVIDNCGVYFECKILYKHEIRPDQIQDDSKESWYYDEDNHVAFYAEVLDCYFNN